VWGEDQVAHWYRNRGYEVLARNWRVPEGELDLVVARDGVVAFCEVKSRSSDAFGQPFEAVTPAKQARLRRLAARWLAADGRSWPVVRFDVASVVRGRVAGVIESAF
jgi:putative endonuclease